MRRGRPAKHVQGTILFHAPCFDGVASAVLTHDCLSAKAGWVRISLKGVNYDTSGRWLQRRLKPNTAVVDFLFHPGATFWADHHATTFLDPASAATIDPRNRWMVYDRSAPACARLLQRHFASRFQHRSPQFNELVLWASRIDSAEYDSPEQALALDIPAVRISLSLSAGRSADYPARLVRWLLESPLDAVAARPTVAARAAVVARKLRAGLSQVEKAARLTDDGIVVFDIDDANAQIPRYGPYHFYPGARYSVGLVRRGREAKVTAMRNPWKTFESVPLGGVLARHGGGGHHRVASVVLKGTSAARGPSVLREVVADIRRGERQRLR